MALLLYTHPDRKDILGFYSLCVCLCTVRVGVHGSCTRVEAREQPCLLPWLKQGFLFPAPTPRYLAFSSLGSIPPSYLRSTTGFVDTFTWLRGILSQSKHFTHGAVSEDIKDISLVNQNCIVKI